MSSNMGVELLNKKPEEINITFKIIILGDSYVGKSCLALKVAKGSFDPNYKTTVGFEFLDYSVKINDFKIRLQIWDTCGQETYRSLITSFYNSSALAILVYSIDDEKSFNNLEMWLNEIKTKGNPDISIILIGNKADLENKRKVTKEMAIEWCENNGIKTFIETSAKDGKNVEDIFNEAAKILLEQHQKHTNRIKNTESMRNVFIENKALDKNASKELISDFSSRPRKKKCCD